jgi:hypothetical protein
VPDYRAQHGAAKASWFPGPRAYRPNHGCPGGSTRKPPRIHMTSCASCAR